MMDGLIRNGSGCVDPTAADAIRNVEKENERQHELLMHIFYMCNLAGFSVEGRIVLRDKRTGRIWR